MNKLSSSKRARPTDLAWLASVSVAALIGAADPALAQSRDQATQVEEVVVSARRTEEALQTTPVAVTALTEAALDRKQITDLFALQHSVPDLVIGQTGNSAGATVSLRGQVTVSSEVNVDQSVGLYQDGVYSARSQAGILNVIDVQRIEVLRGPQGTLFGRNTTGGAINIITNDPTGEREGWLRAGYGNYNSWEVAGVVNVPLAGDQLSARLVAQHIEHDGYGHNIFLNTDVADLDSTYFRGSIKVAPDGAPWDLVVRADYLNNSTAGQIQHLLRFSPAFLPPSSQAYVDAGFYTTASEIETADRLISYGGSATLTVDLGAATLKSISAIHQYHHRSLPDYDSTPTQYFISPENTHHKQYSQEVQLYGDVGNLKWIGGLYYFSERAHQVYNPLGRVIYDGIVDNSSFAPYVQATYSITEKLRATAGVRYTWDKRKLVAHNVFPAFGVCLIPPALVDPAPPFCVSHREAKFDYPSYTFGLDYQWTPNLFVYARTGMAHKSGGFGKASPVLEVFDPEKVTDYEVGVKSDWFDRRLRINAAAFISYYEHMQRPVTSGAGALPVVLTQSIGKSEIPGFEVEATAVPVPGLELTASLGVLDPKYTDFSDATGDRTGEPFTYVSKVTWGLGATYSLPVSYGEYVFHADYAHQSPKWFRPPVVGLPPFNREPGFGLLNAKVSLKLEDPRVEFSVWGQNITAEKYNAFISDFLAGAGTVTGYRGDPRTYGASVTYAF